MPSATVSIVHKRCSASSKNLPTSPALLPNEQSNAQRLPRCAEVSLRTPYDRMNRLHEGCGEEWNAGVRPLKELARSYLTITKDQARVMTRVKAVYRSWAIP